MIARRTWLVAVAAFGVPAALSAFETFMFWRLSDRPYPAWRAVAMEAPAWLVYAALTPAIWWLGDRLPPRRVANLGVHLAAALAAAVLYAATAAATTTWFSPTPVGDYASTALSWFLAGLPLAVLTYAAIAGAGHALTLGRRLRERELAAAQLAAQLAEAKLDALRTQLHPHFLFNSLNAITVLMRDHDVAGATRMLTQLSELLRQVLRSDLGHEIALGDELAFIRRYLAIEQVRFSDRLAIDYRIADDVLGCAVPCFIVQPLVENALRHGIAPRADGGRLELGARTAAAGIEIWVRDDGGGLRDGAPGLGIANTRARLTQLYGDAARLDVANAPGGGVCATLYLPSKAA